MFKIKTKLGSFIGTLGGDVLGEAFILYDKFTAKKQLLDRLGIRLDAQLFLLM